MGLFIGFITWCSVLGLVQFRNILPELSVSQLLEDVRGKNANQCWKCFGNRSVINCKLISFCELDIASIGGSS